MNLVSVVKELIEHPISRQINIIQSLFLSDGALHEKDIALRNDCSLSTVRKDMAKIEKDLADLFDVRIENSSISFF